MTRSSLIGRRRFDSVSSQPCMLTRMLEACIGFRVLLERTARLALDERRTPVPITGGTTSEFGWRELHLSAERV